jgi:pimeloyl-ACP methyl ester carboxylesterase
MKQELVHFLTSDNLRLPGLLYEPDRKSKQIAIYLHGNGTASLFYRPEMNLYGKTLTSNGISFFPFNNRGAHLIKSFRKISEHGEDRALYGTAFELIKESIIDIDSAITFLKSKGYETFYLIGESTGANKIVVYNYYKPKNEISKYILLSGGDDTGLYYRQYGDELFHKILKKCKEMIQKGKGMEFVPKYISVYPMSYRSIYDTINPEGDYNIFPYFEILNKLNITKKEKFRELKSINKPTLVVYGDQDEFCFESTEKCIEVLKKNISKKDLFTFEIIKDADHGFTGKEEILSTLIVNWLQTA